MDSRNMSLKCAIPKAVKRCLAWILTLAMVFSGVPLRGSGGVIQVSADNTKLGDSIPASGPAVYASAKASTTGAAFATGHTQATWGYAEILEDSSGNTTSILQGNISTGTYTNSDGDVLYIDASTGKFAPNSSNTRIQVNNGTKIYVPVTEDKVTITILMNKNCVTTAEALLTDVLSVEGVNNNLLSATCKSLETDSSDSGYKAAVIECYIDGGDGELLLTSIYSSSNYYKSISVECETLSTITVSGTVTCTETLPAGCQIILTNTSNGIEYKAPITSGNYSIAVPVENTASVYKFSVSSQEYQVDGDVQITLSSTSSNPTTENITLSKLSTYILSGNIVGIGTGYDVSSLNLVFTTEESSIFTPVVNVDTDNLTYTAKLEKGTTYKVTAEGVNDYQIDTPKTIVYNSDTTQNITFSEKTKYPITISLGSTPNLSSMNVEYIFVHEDGLKYSFTDITKIELRDGTYAVSLGGDFEQVAYKLSSGNSLTVNGAGVSHVITFAPVTTWSFVAGTGEYYNKTIQSSSGYYQGLYIDATSGKLAPNGAPPNSAQFNTGAVINVPVTGKCTIAVDAYQAKYAEYTIDGKAADTTSVTTTVPYEGGEGYVKIESTGSAYIASITVTYPAKEVTFVPQTEMPFVADDDTDANTAHDTDKKPRGSKKDSMVVQPVGQKLNITQTGGAFSGAYKDISNVGYYLFPMTKENNKLEFDLVIHSANNNNGDGAFIGLFTNSYAYTLGIRKGTNARAIYTKGDEASGSDFAGAGGINNTIELGAPMHIEISLVKGKPTITYTLIETGATGTAELSPISDTEEGYYYGLVVSDANVTITNMLYTAEDNTVLYDQNSCYYPQGSEPVASNVKAEAAVSREYIDISWNGSVPEDDGTYVVEMSKDGGEWIELADDVTKFTYRYVLPEGDGGKYLFRVCGQLGRKALGGTRNTYVTMTTPVDVLGALAKPVVAITSNASNISLDWEDNSSAEYYLVYRYSYDEGESAITQIAKVTDSSYTDTAVEKEMPYYYKVKAVSETAKNESPLSETVWAVATAGHTGEYVYEDEATEIVLTKKSYDTVFTNKVTLEGTVFGEGTLSAYVNDSLTTAKEMSARDTFSFELTVKEGRNDVNLIFEDKAGNQTRKTYNFVYLTNYDIIADASHTGADGELVNGIPTYKTVQAAVDYASSLSSADKKVILVMAGDYKERLIVNTPNVSLIGEDRESTLIHCYPANFGEKYEAGGDMDKRCATYIEKGASEFSAENISFANDYVYSTPDGKGNKSADALRCDADGASFINVKFVGVQDTLYMDQGNQYYYKCRIEGLIDFIYSGDNARVFFNDCEIIFVYESTKTSGYVCAPKTAENADYGLTFYNCVIIGEEGCSGTGYLLARPWGKDAYITWINCYMGKSVYRINPYSSMSGNQPEDARFFEYGTYGPGFAINANRRQISKNAADNMISNSYLGWNPDSVITELSENYYIGTVVTDREPMYVTSTSESDSYLWSDGNDAGLKAYDMEGYASSYGVSGGGLLKEESNNYYKVDTAEEFLNALIEIKTSGKKSVIELTGDINLGCNEIENFDSYSSIITQYKAQPLTHPTLKKSGVSVLNFTGMYNLTIFSSNASSIKHANITMKNSENIIIRNIRFDELWEWDEATAGDYDRNDWDYMTIDQGCNGIWIDHCTFYKAYDGVIDVKNPAPEENVTISWCEFLPGSEGDIFFDAMMDEIFNHPESYPSYQHMLDEGMTNDQVYMYAYGQKKTHLFGQGDDATNAVGIRVTLANNYYKNSMDRMPRLRYGYSHVYNCIMDSQDLLDAKETITNSDIAKKIVSNGAASTCGAQILLENCYINGIQNALNSGNGSSPPGYINAINSVYYMNQEAATLEPKNNSTNQDQRVLVTEAEAFRSALPYKEYVLYKAENLETLVLPFAGAGKLELTVLQWEKTSYNDTAEPEDPDEPETTEPDEPETTAPDEPETTAPDEPETTAPDEPETTAPDEPETTVPDEPETTAPDEPETTRPSNSNDSDDDDDDYEERETTSLTSREENIVENVLGTTSVKEVTENRDGKLVVGVNNDVVFIEKDGTLSTDKWQQVGGAWYYFGGDSKAVDGWLQQGDKWYYLNEDDKRMETGWLKTSDGKWYLLDETNGDMKTGWQQAADGTWYLLDENNGDMKTGWQQTADGTWYLLDENNGDMKTGWQQTSDGKWYLLDEVNGDMKIGWQMVNGVWYYLTETGAMAEDTITPDGYRVGKDGAWTGESVR